jgi:chaperonin GroES
MSATLKVSQIQPLAGYVLVKPAEPTKKTASGIYLAENSEEKPIHGTVIAVGADTTIDGVEVKSPVKKKDMVLYKKWGGNEITLDDIEYQILKFEDILATITK